MHAQSPPSQPIAMTGPEDQLLAAEAEFSAASPGTQELPVDRTRDEGPPGDHSAPPVSNDNDGSSDQQPRKKLKLTEADKKRSVRMFGALMGTLSKFHDETSRTKQTDAAKRRAAVESRLQAKLKIESEALHQLRAFEVEEKNLKQQGWRKAEEFGHLSEIKPIQFANRIALSNFLCTSSSKSKAADRTDLHPNAYTRSRNQDKPIYWLPHKLLPEQKEQIESQCRAAREEVEEQQQMWKEEQTAKQEELEQLQARRDARLAEIEVEKARSRLNASSVPAADQTAAENPTLNQASEMGAMSTREMPEMRQDTPDVINENGRDEDAVEY